MGEATVNFRHRALRASDKRVSLPGSTEYATVLCAPRAVGEPRATWSSVEKDVLAGSPETSKTPQLLRRFPDKRHRLQMLKKTYLEMKQL